MNTMLTTYLLAGALAASLAWNFCMNPKAPPSDCTSCSATGGDCSAAIAELDLSDEQRAALARWNTTLCRQSGETQARASKLAQELYTRLADAELDAAKALALADEVGRLRAQALRECIDSLIEVRRVLTPAQLEQLLGRCCAPTSR